MHEKTNTHRLVLSISRAGLSKHTYQFPRAFRIRLAHGLDCSKAVSTSIAPPLVRSSLIGQRFSSVPMSPSDISGLLRRHQEIDFQRPKNWAQGMTASQW